MKLLQQLIIKIWFVPIISIGLGGNLMLENNNNGTWNVLYDSDTDIAGFQFDVDGDGVTIDSAYGGEAQAAGLEVTSNSTTVKGSPSQATIPSAIGGTLVVLELTGEPTGLSNMIIFDLYGNAMDFTFIWIGCMDDGNQQWSPNPGSPACNFWAFAIIEGECLYNDCTYPEDGSCGGTSIVDCAGVCGGGDNACIDCSGFCSENQICIGGNNEGGDCSENGDDDCPGIPNGSSYLDVCGNCVGGNIGNSDEFEIGIDSIYLKIPSGFDNHRVSVNASNVGILNSFYMELDYDSIYIQIIDFIDGIELYNYDYELAHSDSIINSTSFNKRVRFSLFYSPHPFDCSQYDNQQCENSGDCFFNTATGNCERKLNQFSNECNPNIIDNENNDVIFQIKLNASEVTRNIYTPISIHNLVLNEHPLDIIKDWDILVYDPEGCDEEGACNYNPNTLFPDNEVCEYPGDENWPGCDCDGNENDDCEIDCPDGNEPDCNNDCGGSAYIDSDCGEDFCAGGNTDNECIEDCSGVLNGSAYEDFCTNCIEALDDIDCFYSSFNIYNSIGNVVVDTTIAEFANFYVALHMQNLPNSLEGIIVNIGFDTSVLSLNDWSINPNNLDIEGDLTGELGSSYILEGDTLNTTFRASIFGNTNEFYQGNGGNILFLQFSNIGNNGDSTVISYNNIQVNEHVMKEQNYTSQVIYFGDCIGIFNGDTPPDDCGICGGGNADMDECGVCFGPGTIYECGCENIPEGTCDCDGNTIPEGTCDCDGNTIPEGTCDCDGNTPADLYGGEGYNCEGELSINEILIPKSFKLSQNYPNPFNPITYIQYSVPQFNFVTIEIINISGQIIKTIVQSSHQPGNYEIKWDATNQNGISVQSGIYFYKLDADEFISVKKLVLLK